MINNNINNNDNNNNNDTERSGDAADPRTWRERPRTRAGPARHSQTPRPCRVNAAEYPAASGSEIASYHIVSIMITILIIMLIIMTITLIIMIRMIIS